MHHSIIAVVTFVRFQIENWQVTAIVVVRQIYIITIYLLLCNKKSRCYFDDKLKVGDVRYKHLTQITIKVQLFWRLPYEM